MGITPIFDEIKIFFVGTEVPVRTVNGEWIMVPILSFFAKVKNLFISDSNKVDNTRSHLYIDMLKGSDLGTTNKEYLKDEISISESNINEIDLITVSKNRDVIFIEFNRNYYLDYKYEDFLSRNKLIKFLNENNIDFLPSLYAQKEHSYEMYKGQLYIDLKINKDDEKFKLLNNYVKEDNHIICTQYLLNDAIEHQKTKNGF
jgi:hypothetical protein